jgi:hypothetical protein
MLRLTASQCRRARGLLKWNQRDLHHKSKVPPQRIDFFEQGVLHLQHGENKAIHEAFKEEGILFLEPGYAVDCPLP